MILSADFLSKYNATFDFRRRCVHLRDLDQRTTVHWGTKAEDDRPTTITNQSVPSRLPPQQHNEFQSLIRTFHKLFDNKGLPSTTPTMQHEIKVTEHQPFRLQPYRYSLEKRIDLAKQIQEMLEDGVIEASNSPYN